MDDVGWWTELAGADCASLGGIGVVVSLQICRRNGRARMLLLGERLASSIQDIAAAEKVSDRFVSRMVRLAYLSPEVLEQLLIRRVPPAVSLNDLAAVAERPWGEQIGVVFSNTSFVATASNAS